MLPLNLFLSSFLNFNINLGIFQFSSVQSLRCVLVFVTPWTAACQASLSITDSRSLLKLISIESVMQSTISSSVVPFSSPPSIFPSIRGFSNELILCIRWPKFWSFSFSISTAETNALETDGKSSLKKILSDFSYTVHLSNLD